MKYSKIAISSAMASSVIAKRELQDSKAFSVDLKAI
jgi:hypothetical protein